MQAVPWDLYAALAYPVVVTGILLATGVGNPLGLFLVVLVPGYLATAALLPRAADVGWIVRVALSLGLSFALVAFLGLLLDETPFGVTFTSTALSVLAASLGLGTLAYLRRMAVPADQRLEVTLNLAWAPWKEYSLLEKGLAVALIAVLALTIPFLGLALTQPRPVEAFTELYLLGPTGNFTGIPGHLNASEPGTVQIVAANHEGATVNYTLRVAFLGVQIVVNATTGANETIVLNRTAGPSFGFTLGEGGTWTQPYTFSLPAAGTWWVEFDLFRGQQVAAPYRGVHLLITVP